MLGLSWLGSMWDEALENLGFEPEAMGVEFPRFTRRMVRSNRRKGGRAVTHKPSGAAASKRAAVKRRNVRARSRK